MVKEKGSNPMDSFRKEQKKKEQKKAKEVRDSAREIRDLLNNPGKIDEEIEKVQKQSNENKLDKGLKDKIVELKRMKEVALQKQRIDAAQGKRVVQKETSSATAAPSITKQSHSDTIQQQYIMQQQQQQYYAAYYGMIPSQGYSMLQGGHQQPHGYPGGQYPMPVAIGGMNGIPLPPPRPPPIVAPNNPPANDTRNAKRGSQKNRPSSTGYIDPLDPSATGYTEQYGRQQQQNRQQSIPDHSSASLHLTTTNTTAPIITNEPVQISDELIEDEDQGLKERLAALSASYTNVGTIAVRDEEHMPSGPHVSSIYATSGSSTKRNRDAEESDENPHSSKRKKDSGHATVLPGMEFYAFDDDEVEDGQVSDHKSDDDDSVANDVIGPSFPTSSVGYEEYGYASFPALMDPEEYLRQLQAQNENRADVFVEDDDDDDEEEGDRSEYQATKDQYVEKTVSNGATSESSVLTTAKVDAALTAFRPTAVLKKKTATNDSKKQPTFVPKPPSIPPPPSVAITKAAETTAAAVDLDDDYDRFMSEINELGDL